MRDPLKLSRRDLFRGALAASVSAAPWMRDRYAKLGASSLESYRFTAEDFDRREPDFHKLATTQTRDDILVRAFDDTEREGVPFTIGAVPGATKLWYSMLVHSDLTGHVVMQLHMRQLFEGRLPAWQSLPPRRYTISPRTGFKLAEFDVKLDPGVKGCQLELVRLAKDPGDDLCGDFNVHATQHEPFTIGWA